MKRIIHFIATAIVLMTACNKTEPAPEQEQYDKYIFFSSSVETKASLIEKKSDLNGKTFGVVGYKYDKSTDWAHTTTGNLEPVFYDYNAINQLVSTYSETVSINSNGLCSYEPLQGWSNTKKYTFFAYYPDANLQTDNNGSPLLTDGSPSIVHEMDCTSATTLKESMLDVMTATCHKDLYGYSSIGTSPVTGDINFNFNHRLSSLGVKVRKTSSCDIILNSITLKVSGIKYDKIIIPLDEAKTPERTSPATAIATQEFSLTLMDNEKSGAVTNNGNELSDKLIFIPQSENISIQAIVNYTRTAPGYIQDITSEVTLPTLTTALVENNKHLIQINFSDSTVSVSSIANSGWVDVEDVYDTFN